MTARFDIVLFLLLVTCAGSFSQTNSQYNPLKDPYKCGLPTCTDTKFKYGPKFQQTYLYTTEVHSIFNGTSKNESSLYIEASAQFTFPTPCEGILTLYDVKLRTGSNDSEEHPSNEQFSDDLTKTALRFSFRDGIISELCPSNELEWTLNFKRGILNMLHNTMKRFDLDYYNENEEDIRGKCKTEYKVLGASGTSLNIMKTKNLTSCIGSGRIRSAIQAEEVPFFYTNAKKDSILKSTSTCQLSIDHNIYNKIQCQESHLFKPLSNHGTGATTTVIQNLVLKEETPSLTPSSEEEITQRVSLAFNYAPPVKPAVEDWSNGKILVEKLCQIEKTVDQKDFSDIFNQFVYVLREFSNDALTEFYTETSTICPTGRKHFLDALPFVATGPSVTLIKTLMLDNLIPENTVREWMTLIAFIPEPDEEIISAVSEIMLQSDNFEPEIMLKISTVVRNYCKWKGECENDENVWKIIEHLEGKFTANIGKSNEREIYDEIMVVLKSLSTIGYASETFKIELHEIIKSSKIEAGIRVAAVEVFRRISCLSTRPFFQDVFTDEDQDAEVRIASYLQIMRCPDYLMIQVLRKSLQDEEVNQVGSFVWSHLKNLLKSTIPNKVEIQSLISEKDLINKFDSDMRKFSRNFEGSLYFDNYNVGGSLESNVIFSPSSYVPKTAMLNFSTVLFGETINFLEVYTRLDGFEKYLESTFGLQGTAKSFQESVMEKLRFARGQEGNATLLEQVEEMPDVTSKFADEPKVILGMKVFGNDLKYSSFNGKKEIWDAVQNLDPIYHLKKILSGKEIIYDKSFMFLDAKFVTPTGAGLPLILSASGTTTLNVKLSGSLSSKSGGIFDLNADVRPTASLDITGDMSVDAFHADAGIKLKVGVYTDSAVQGVVKVRGGGLVSANFSLPKESNEIVVAKSEILVKRNGKAEQQRGISGNHVSKSACTWSPIERTIGLKLCSNYTYTNIPHPENPLYFLIASPTTFRLSMYKSDKTANIYFFQYKKVPGKNKEVISLTFDTPGSKIKRLMNSNLTISKEGYDLNVYMESGEGAIMLMGKFKNLPSEKMLKLTLDVDSKRRFDGEASLTLSGIRNGVVYKPVIYINVNGESIMKTSGHIDFISKRGISQYTVDLKFETKRLTSTLFGYISTTPSSIEASLYGDYKFIRTKTQRVTVKFGVANKSRRNIVVLVGFCSLFSTTYPNLNIDANATFQRSGSHMDLTLKLKQNPLPEDDPRADFRSLNFNLFLSYKTFIDNKRTLTIESSISRKSSNLDLKGSILYETFRHNVNIVGSVKYSKDKEALMTIFWSHPRSTLEQIKLHLNVTVPSFKPMIVRLEIDEKEPKHFMIDFHGTWISGHSMSAVGFYNDKSKSTATYRHAKFLLRSPSFKDINLDIVYYRSNVAIQLNVQADYEEKDEYQLALSHQYKTEFETHTSALFKYKNRIYKFGSAIYDGSYKKIDVELHLDQLRDVRFKTYLLNEPNNKTVEFEVNWDANRDPSQKLMATLNYRKNDDFDYASNLIVTYPGRTVKGDFKFVLESRHLETLIGLSWEEGRTVALNLDIEYGIQGPFRSIKIKSQINTPIDNWKIVKFITSYEHVLNKYKIEGELSWDKRKKIILDVLSDYEDKTTIFWCNHRGSITSTVDAIPNVNISIWHNKNETNIDTNLHLMYNPEFLIDLDSRWRIEEDQRHTNLTGTMRLKTPYENFGNGFLRSKLSLKDRKYLKGVADIDIDHKKAWVNLEGKYKKLTDCMLVVNASMFEDDYQFRFIISAENKHLVSMLSYPEGNVGTEVLLDVRRITDFNVKFQLATPIQFLQNVILVAKLKDEEADFKVGWNVLLLGVEGVWHYKSLTDFHYAYKVFTPLRDFEENYVIAKLILQEGLDFGVGIKFSKYKLGLRLMGKDIPKPFKEIKNSDNLSWKGRIEVDVLIYPTMKGALEVDQNGSIYTVRSKLTMPNGVAELIDEFEFIDVFKMKNDLKITTPFVSFKTITSNYVLNVVPEKIYIFGLNLHYQNASTLIKTGIYVNYNSEVKETYEKIYNVVLNINTPFKSFPTLNAQGVFKSEEDFYYTRLLFETLNSDIALDATTEIDNDALDFTSSFHVITPTIHIPSSNLRLIKFLTPTNNYLEANLSCPEKFQNDVYLKLSWLIKSRNEFKASVELESPFAGLEKTKAGTEIYLSNVRSQVSVLVQLSPIILDFNSTLINNRFQTISNLDFNNKRYPMVIDCHIKKVNGKHNFDGTLNLAGKNFKIVGTGITMGSMYSDFYLKLVPVDQSPPVEFHYHITPININEYQITGSLNQAEKRTNFNGSLIAGDWYNWHLIGEMSSSKAEKFLVDAKAKSDKDSVDLIVDASTPIVKMERPHLEANYKSSGFERNLYAFFKITETKITISVRSFWNFLENMYFKTVGQLDTNAFTKFSSVEAFYENPRKAFHYLSAGGDIHLDKIWEAGSNITAVLPLNNTVSFEGHFKAPDGNKETHSLYAHMDYTDRLKNIIYSIKYRANVSKKRYGTWGKVLTEDMKNLTGDVELEWDGRNYNNFANVQTIKDNYHVTYTLKTPKYADKKLVVASLSYKPIRPRHNVTFSVFYPEKSQLSYLTIDYQDVSNMKGMFNTSVPHKDLNYTGAYFDFKTNSTIKNRYIKVFWKGNYAVLDSICDIIDGPSLLDSNTKGRLTLDVPLKTRHLGRIDYEYDKKGQKSKGTAVIYYNKGKMFEGEYTCDSQSRAGQEKDVVHAEVRNRFFPLGADYIRSYEYDGDPNHDTTDKRHLHLFHLTNKTKFSITGELEVHNIWTGQEYVLTVSNNKKTIKIYSDYNIFDKIFKQHSKIELDVSHWLEYELSLVNRTQDNIFDSQEATLNVMYPKRSFTTNLSYNVSEAIAIGKVELEWDKRNIGTEVDWRKNSVNRDQIIVKFKHPTFEKDVTIFSEYGYNKASVDGFITVDYSRETDRKLTLKGELVDHSNLKAYNYTGNMWAEHNATNLKLNSDVLLYWNREIFGVEQITKYRRSYLPESTSEIFARVKLNENEIELKKDTIATDYSYFWTKYSGSYPIYQANIKSVHDMVSQDGIAYINFKQKLMYINMNLTEDGTQSLHLHGTIPDARTVLFDVWRDYDDRKVVDVAYYLRLNHSRLVMSNLKWRPDLYSDIQYNVRSSLMKIYLDTLEGINNTRHYVKSETIDTVNGIWLDAQPFTHGFLEDLRNITVIENDLQEFKIFLNNSYNNNDFYIKDIVNITLTMLDELAIKSQLQTLPKIVQEIWSLMGESGAKIKKSIHWVIGEILVYYKNTTDFIHSLLDGDPIQHISTGLDKLVERYDNFIKNLHVTVIQYMENLWAQTLTFMVEHWNRFLASLEPTFIKFLHYLESIVWTTGKEFLDFLYMRRNEFIESPYFVKFTKLSQDIDKFYKDITGNNTLGAVYKYSEIGWNFFKEKFLSLIPFGKELSDVVTEIVTELKQISNIATIKYFIVKLNELYDDLKYYYDYFGIEVKIQSLIRLVYRKIVDYSSNALEVENRQRKAKTKFIFDPNEGVMILEQKLPMSWHAFNETPKFKEIPEIKKLYDLKNYFETSKMSFWTFYNNYKLLTDPSMWFPPFDGRAMIIGPSHIVSFDGKHYNLKGSCTYLLTRDFSDKNFTILASYDNLGQVHELVVVLKKTVIQIGMTEDRVIVDSGKVESLPIQFRDVYLYRFHGKLIMEGTGFRLECNSKFRICTFDVSGWYFGKTAGLWGTFNNEPSDDLILANRTRSKDPSLVSFANTWSLNKSCKTKKPSTKIHKPSQEVMELCEEFFTGKISELSNCFDKVPKEEFMKVCLESNNRKEACTSAVAYVDACTNVNMPLRIPESCVWCTLHNGTDIKEGEFIRFQGDNVVKQADVVFVVEAKNCNKNPRNFDLLIDSIEKELQSNNITNNRYALVTFGGNGVFDEPRSIIIDGKTFTNSRSIWSYFNKISIGDGNKDIFSAIMFAYDLHFRPGASRNFILVPCSECKGNNMEYFDYSTVHQFLSEGAVSLHILMNDYFTLQKEGEVKVAFGIDRRFAYTKRDVRTLIGDQSLKKSIHLPKSSLGMCLSLAMETNGTVFSAKFLEGERKNSKKFATVHAQLIARSAIREQCIDCECTGEDSGVSFIECYLCSMTNSGRNNVEQLFTFEDDDSINTMNMLEGFSLNTRFNTKDLN